MVEIAVVGVGGWGKNLARNYSQIPEANLRYICDRDQKKLDASRKQYPGTKLTTEFSDLLNDP
jgi:predicted dehydrogenase